MAQFGRFRLLRELGRGATSIVVEGVDDAGEHVALKVPHPVYQVPQLEAALGRLVEISAAITSPHVVRALGVESQSYQRALVVELVEGGSLAQIGVLDEAHVQRIADEIEHGLHAIHDAHGDDGPLGLVHGDVAPANILLGVDGRARLTDFGHARRHAMSALTHSGAFTGTPGYIAPEVVRGLPPSPASDYFGLGATLLESLTGRPTFPGNTPEERAMAAVERHVESPATPLGKRLARWLSKRPERRI